MGDFFDTIQCCYFKPVDSGDSNGKTFTNGDPRHSHVNDLTKKIWSQQIACCLAYLEDSLPTMIYRGWEESLHREVY